MLDLLYILALTLLAGLCIPLGGWFASFEHIRPRWLENEFRHFVIALGGGILTGAVAFVLVPEGLHHLDSVGFATLIIIAGGFVFFAIERAMGCRRRESPQLMGMVLDFVPEAIALGGMIALGSDAAFVLAILIALQNLPEGFNTYRELDALTHHSQRKILISMSGLVLLGPASALAGFYVFADAPELLGAIMLFASGGVLYLIFQDIAPQSRLRKHWAPPLGAVVGFCLAVFSNSLVVGSF